MTMAADIEEVPETEVPHLSWDEAMRLMYWKQGEHVTLIGPTGVSKTEAMIYLLNQRKWVVFITTKKKDETQDQLRGYRVATDPHMVNTEICRKFIFRVPWSESKDYDTELIPIQRDLLKRLMMKLFQRGAWTIALDELPYVADQLALKSTLKLLWLQGRSGKVSVIANTQRPRNVPLEAYSQAKHLLIWNTPDSQDIVRSGDFVALDRAKVLRILKSCGEHDVLYVNVQKHDKMCITNTRD